MSNTKTLLSIAEASEMSAARIATAFHERHVLRSKAFLEQGKLIYAIQKITLPKGKSIQGIITAKGTPSGSVGNARKAAAIIEALVVSGLVEEKTFDKLATFRLVRMANKVLGNDKDTKPVMTIEQLADVVNEPKVKSGAIADTLEIWHEHGKSPADHEADLKAQDADKAKAEKEAADRAAEIEAADKEQDAETEEVTPTETEAPTETETETPTETEEATPTETEEVTPPSASVIKMPEASSTPEPVQAEDVLAELYDVRIKAADLDAEGMAAVLHGLEDFQHELTESIKAAKEKAA